MLTVRLSLVLVVVIGAGLFFWEPAISQGFAMGGVAGVLTFWILARRLEKFATMQPEKIQSDAIKGAFLRMVIYGLVLARAYYLDPETTYPLFAATGGIFIPRVVIYFVAFTGADLKQDEQ